jgi:hypothetical protein
VTQREDRSAKVGGWAGIGFVVSAWSASFLYVQPPRIDSSPRVILEWAHKYRATISIGMVMGIFASLLFVLFVTSIHRRLADAGEDFLGSVVYGSGILYVAFSSLATIPWAMLVMMDRQPGGVTDGNVPRLLLDLGQIIYAPGTGLIGLFFLTVGAAAVRAGVFSRWVGWTAIVMGLLDVAYIIPSVVNTGWHIGWGVLLYASGPGLTIVVLILCIQILRRPPPQAPQPSTRTPATAAQVQST